MPHNTKTFSCCYAPRGQAQLNPRFVRDAFRERRQQNSLIITCLYVRASFLCPRRGTHRSAVSKTQVCKSPCNKRKARRASFSLPACLSANRVQSGPQNKSQFTFPQNISLKICLSEYLPPYIFLKITFPHNNHVSIFLQKHFPQNNQCLVLSFNIFLKITIVFVPPGRCHNTFLRITFLQNNKNDRLIAFTP